MSDQHECKKIIVVGTGYWARKMHLPALLPLVLARHFQVVGVCDLDLESAASFAQPLQCKETSALLKPLIEKTNPAGVVLLLPPAFIPNFIRECCSFNIPFFCEKPPSTSSIEHQTLILSVGEIPHIVGFNRRFSPVVQQGKEWLKDQKIESIFCDFTRVERTNEDFSTTYIHSIDTVLYLLNSKPTHAEVKVQYHETYENIYVLGATENNTIFILRIMPNTGSSQGRYFLKAQNKSVDISFSQGISIDAPGYVELHEKDKIVEHKTPVDFGLKFDDHVGLAGMRKEYTSFHEILCKQNNQISTLQNTIQSRILTDGIATVIAKKETSASLTF